MQASPASRLIGHRSMEPSRALAAVAFCAGVLCLGTWGGCSSAPPDPGEAAEELRRNEERLAEEKKRAPFVIDPPAPLFSEMLVESESGEPYRCAKPGHWTSTVQSMTARYDDFSGELTLSVVDPDDAFTILPLRHTPFRIVSRRPAVLAKGRPKRIEGELLLPDAVSEAVVAARFREADSSREVTPTLQRKFPLMPDYQYFLVVLADEPSRYGFLSLMPAVRVPWADDTADHVLHYRVVLADGNQRLPLPPNVLTWTSAAYVVWDEVNLDRIDALQQQALIDWIHWGGRLLISGPGSIDALRGSFLAPYLPVDSPGGRVLTTAELADFSAYWGSTRDGATTSELKLDRSWAGVELAPRDPARDRPLPGAEGLAYERDVGLGSVVVTAMSLAEEELVNWAGYDSFFNGALLRRPARTYSERREGDWQATVGDWADYRTRTLDPLFTTPLRWFARDLVDLEAANAPGAGTGTGTAPAGVADPNLVDPAGALALGFAAEAARTVRGGLGAWSDFGPVSSAARGLLAEAAGVRVPGASFVLLVLAVYLVVLVPLNWMVFQALGRVEWAWFAAPAIAIAGAAAVVHLAQLDIGFVSARTDLAVLELQEDHPRGHLTRYMALYTSLSSQYDLEFNDPSAVATPFPSDAQFELRLGDRVTTAVFEKYDQPRLRDLEVASASTLMVHSEEMLPLAGPLRLTRSSRGADQVENRTGLALRDAMVIRRTAGRDGTWRVEGCWLGELRPGAIEAIPWTALSLPPRGIAFAQRREQAAAVDSQTRYDLDPLLELACRFVEARDPLHGRRDEVRLIARVDEVLPGVEAAPQASQVGGAAVVVAHLKWGARQAAERDARAFVPAPLPRDLPLPEEQELEADPFDETAEHRLRPPLVAKAKFESP